MGRPKKRDEATAPESEEDRALRLDKQRKAAKRLHLQKIGEIPMGICGANLPGREGTCKLSAGWGTDHPGIGACRNHGGNAPRSILAAARPALSVLIGMHIEVHPWEAMLMGLRISAAEVTYWSAQIATLEEKQILQRPKSEQLDKSGNVHDLKTYRAKHPYLRYREEANDRMMRYSKMCLDAKVDERMVRVAEQRGEKVGQAFRLVFDELGLTPDQQERAPEIVRRHLLALEAGSAAAIEGAVL